MQQQMAKVAIPDDLTFSDLHLSRDPDGGVSFDWAVIERRAVCWRFGNFGVYLVIVSISDTWGAL